MIPILYSATETAFTSNGLGALVDAISCVVTEERNGLYELEMVYPIDGQHFDDMEVSCVIKALPSDGASEQLFRVYRISKPLNGKCTISAQHISYQLSNIPCLPFTANSAAECMANFPSYAVETCPFTFWTDVETTGAYTQNVPGSIRSRLGGQEGSLLDLYGGELEWDNYTVKLHSARGTDRDVTLRYGKNITDIRQEKNIEDTCTGILPYYYDGETTVRGSVVYSSNASSYPYKRTKAVDYTSDFDEVPTASDLTSLAQSRIENVDTPSINITVSFVALWQTEEYKDIACLERVKLCDTVGIYFEKLGINATAKVIKTEYNVLLERYNFIELGDAKSTLSETIVETNLEIKKKPSVTRMQAAIAAATQLITGVLGGYLVFQYDANGFPTELLIMDQPDISTAVKVWRWNLNGLGYSSSGYNGPYTTAITQDGSIVADFITTGTLDASLASITNISASNINTGTLDASQVTVRNLNASNITTGTLDASQVTVSNLNASNITTGTLDASTVDVTNLNADNITSGTLTASNSSTGYSTVINTATGIIQWVMQYSQLGSDGTIYIKDGTYTRMKLESNHIYFYAPRNDGKLAGVVETTYNLSTGKMGIGMYARNGTSSEVNIGYLIEGASAYTTCIQIQPSNIEDGNPVYIKNTWSGTITSGGLTRRYFNGLLVSVT